ncbi:hypothetical protein FQ775_13960 [Nitratireductor mangrovi]|uniref:Uncharacterized protein n=1 Tax=Nitratireductor mangrovi TaxID=2599600 RepID=A0A5B8L0Q0_9HYPH|nr:hypothetical protein [Nitratireductor mangrovi]QDZ01393.1 hypothetical protein FQ775_13960 [Nitratireductor mangrovi]
MTMKLLATTVLAIGLGMGGAIAQTTSATSKTGSGPNFKSEEEQMMYQDNAEIMGPFFTDETMTTLRPEGEVAETFAAAGADNQAEIRAACDRAMSNRGSYGTVTVALCEQIGQL